MDRELKQPPGSDVPPMPKHAARLFSPVLVDSLAGISAVVAGGVTFWREVLSESYSNFTALDLVDDIKKKYRVDFGPSHVQKLKGMDKAESAKLIIDQNADYHQAVAKRMEEAGFGSFSKRMELLSGHERWKIGLTSMAVVGVSLGSLFLLTRNMLQPRLEGHPESSFAPRAASFVEAQQNKTEQNRSLAI